MQTAFVLPRGRAFAFGKVTSLAKGPRDPGFTEANCEFYVFNTHLDHVSEEARVQGSNLIVKTMFKLQARRCVHCRAS